jgi:hypothetical protein
MLSQFAPTPRTAGETPCKHSSQPKPGHWPAIAADNWLRHIVEGGALRANVPRVRAKYLENKFQRVAERPWALELSGRALSLATDIREKADQAANELGGPPKFKLRAVALGSVRRFRDHGNLDVFIEPTSRDPAHTNLVIVNEPPPVQNLSPTAKEPHEIYRQIATILKVYDPDVLEQVEVLRCTDH